MFGILRPHRRQLDRGDRVRYATAYCNLCGILSSQYGLKSRMLVVHDIATLWWLLSPPSVAGGHVLKVSNCIGGGVRRLRNRKISDLHQLLAALSVHMVAIKVDDDVADTGRWRSRLARRMFRDIFQKVRRDLVNVGFDIDRLDGIISLQKDLEQEGESDFRSASEPTAQAYGLVAREIAVRCSSQFTAKQAEHAGEALGRAVYLVDAVRDFQQDRGTAYNPLCLSTDSEAHELPQQLRNTVLEFVGSNLSCGRRIVMDVAQQLGKSWHAIERAVFAGAGIHDQKSVTLYSGFCVPCGEGKVYISADDCCGCACLLCCCCWCAFHSGP